MRRDGQAAAESLRSTDGAVALSGICRARGFVGRAFGWMGRRSAPCGGLWLEPCGAIHTCFMRFAIDVGFVGADGRVLRICRGVRPWRFVRGPRGSRATLEAPEGRLAAARLKEGVRIAFDTRG